jgi:hypothetical protein
MFGIVVNNWRLYCCWQSRSEGSRSSRECATGWCQWVSVGVTWSRAATATATKRHGLEKRENARLPRAKKAESDACRVEIDVAVFMSQPLVSTLLLSSVCASQHFLLSLFHPPSTRAASDLERQPPLTFLLSAISGFHAQRKQPINQANIIITCSRKHPTPSIQIAVRAYSAHAPGALPFHTRQPQRLPCSVSDRRATFVLLLPCDISLLCLPSFE